jgi:uncharacterized protein with HEPN domain
MQRDDEVYVGHMLDLSRKVASKTAGVRREDFDRDENLRLALAHLLQTIGEAARRVSREYGRRGDSAARRRSRAARERLKEHSADAVSRGRRRSSMRQPRA